MKTAITIIVALALVTFLGFVVVAQFGEDQDEIADADSSELSTTEGSVHQDDGVDVTDNEVSTMEESTYAAGDHSITITTTLGEIHFRTYADAAPQTVENFVTLARDGFYDGVIFHRVIDGFMIQGGDPTGTGRGGPGYRFDDEIDPSSDLYQRGYRTGVVAMANSGPNTNGSQFFIMVADYPLPPAYTIFGEVVSGQEVANAIAQVETGAQDRPLEDVVMQSVRVSEIGTD